jgi:crotonobetainyl-CoA:carnitine CoA-transferase CaiB-like acyl-CoA transferase
MSGMLSAVDQHPSGALSGVVIADFSRVLAGPYCTMLLADMGATVIKVESPEGDETRRYVPPLLDGESTYFLSINRNKQSIALDLADEDDAATAFAIASRADVMVENFKPGGLSRFGLDYAQVSAANPSVVYASITGFGSEGGAKLAGYDLLAQAMSGMMSLTGSPDSDPYRSGVAIFDVMTGLHAALGIVSALHHRRESGEGQRIEVNLLSSALSGMVNQTGGFAAAGAVPNRLGNEHPSIYPYAPLRTGDGDIVITIGNDAQFRRLCSRLGIAEVAADERFRTPPARSANRDALRPLLESALSAHSATQWFDLLTEAGVPAAPILDVQGGVEAAERLGLRPVVEAGSGQRRIGGIRNPITFSRTPPTYDLAPPLLDGDRESILSWLTARATAPGRPATELSEGGQRS